MKRKNYPQDCKNINETFRSMSDLQELEKLYYKQMEESHTKNEWDNEKNKLKKQIALVLEKLFSSIFGNIFLGTNDLSEVSKYIEIVNFFNKHKNDINNYVEIDIYLIEFTTIILSE